MTNVTMKAQSSAEAAIFNMMARRYQAGQTSAISVNIDGASIAKRPAEPAANATATTTPEPSPIS